MEAKNTEQFLQRWQVVINMIAQHYNVPACLVMKVSDDDIKVELSSDLSAKENPYSVGAHEHLGNSGLYCERVIKTQKPLQVINALSDPEWDENPDIKLNMISYLGVPLNWPDQSPFGTLCVLDRKEREFPEDFRDLLVHLSHVFELELSLVEEIEQRKKAEESLRTAQDKLLTSEKLAQFSQFSQGISHQLGTPIGCGVTLSSHIAQLCEQVLKTGEGMDASELKQMITEVQDCNEILISELGKASHLLSSLKLAAQNTGLQDKGKVNLKDCIQEVWSLCSTDDKQVELDISDVACDSITINCAALMDVLQQLFSNAIEHGLVGIANPCIKVIAFDTESSFVIEVSDNGTGMSEDVRKLALQPFYSANREQGKVGLGLNYVNNLVTSTLGGRLDIASSANGTVVSLVIPR